MSRNQGARKQCLQNKNLSCRKKKIKFTNYLDRFFFEFPMSQNVKNTYKFITIYRYYTYYIFFRSFAVICETGYRLFSLSSVDRVDEIFSSNDENTKIAERLFSSSLVAVVSEAEPSKLKVIYIHYILT